MSGLTHIVLISCLFGVKSLPHQDTSLGIVGGHAVDITKVPFMARYRSLDYFQICGAAIVHPKFVISCAQCYYDYEPLKSLTYVTVGTDETESDGQTYDVKDGFPHPKYEYHIYGNDYDIALLKLEKPLEFNERIQAIPLAEKDIVIPEGAKFNVTGFGVKYACDNGYNFLPYQLQMTTVTYITRDKCRHYEYVTERMICTQDNRTGACFDDDGGPLTYENKLVGIASTPMSCGVDTPDRYATALLKIMPE